MPGAEAAVPIGADRVTDALAVDVEHLVAAIGGMASISNRGRAGLLITGVSIPTLNGVLTRRPSAAAADVRALLEIVATMDLPYSLILRPGFAPELVQVARSFGMTEAESIPLMAMPRNIKEARNAADHPDLQIRVLDPDDAGVHVSLAAEGFETPRDAFEKLIPPALMRRPGHKAYVGTVDGQDVTTVFSVLLNNSIGIFDVCTPPRYRGRGYGRAITARAVLDGFEGGADFAYLQSTPMGYKIYQDIGFETIETWRCWVSVPPSRS